MMDLWVSEWELNEYLIPKLVRKWVLALRLAPVFRSAYQM